MSFAPSIGPVALTLLAVWLVVALWASLWVGRNAEPSRRVIVPFLLRVAFPMAVLLGMPLLLVAQIIDLEDRLWQALIAGGVIATGWLATAVFGEIERGRQKAERTRDVHKAIFAEVQNTLSAFWDDGEAEAHAEALVARMEADPDFVPFIPRETHDRVFAAMLPDIEVLPRQTIDGVVAFYSQIGSISAMADDMRGDGFRELPQARRIALFRDYIAMRLRAFAVGQYLLKLIAAYADGGAEAAETIARAAGARSLRSISSPDADPTGPEGRGSA